MKIFIVYIILILCTTPVISQDPQFSWGNKIFRDSEKVEGIEIVGVDKDGFFATYEVNGQISLEHYNPQNERFWNTALLPKTHNGNSAHFRCVRMLKGKLYMISSYTHDDTTSVYAQQISHNGNYTTEVEQLAQGAAGKQIELAVTKDENSLAVVIAGEANAPLTVTLLTADFATRWTKTAQAEGELQEVLVLPDGTTYVLIKAPPAAPATTAFYLHQFLGKNGVHSEVALGHTDYRPLQAKLAATNKGSLVVTGYFSPSNTVASQNPEPTGVFLYRVDNTHIHDRFEAYTPFSARFIKSYKSFKPDYDTSQRLRNLHLGKAIALNDGSVYLVGEVCETENRAGTFVYHNNDILVSRISRDGKPLFITSINKLQSGTNKSNTIRSYFADAIADALKIIYLDFEYNYDDDKAKYSPSSTKKTPVLLTIAPSGNKKFTPLHDTHTGSEEGFYLMPCSAYKVDATDYIIIGLGPDFYRYGRLSF